MPSLSGAILEPHQFAKSGPIGATTRKVVKRPFGFADQMISNERRTLCCALFGVFQAAFPFENRPTVKPVLGEP
jgi:hypothetical protein